MLLVEKMANRVVRQNDADSHNSLNLSLVLMQRHDPSVQLQVRRHVHFIVLVPQVITGYPRALARSEEASGS